MVDDNVCLSFKLAFGIFLGFLHRFLDALCFCHPEALLLREGSPLKASDLIALAWLLHHTLTITGRGAS